jgi:hypothetical protein
MLAAVALLSAALLISANANDVYVCGGFVKTSIPIDFTQVSVCSVL